MLLFWSTASFSPSGVGSLTAVNRTSSWYFGYQSFTSNIGGSTTSQTRLKRHYSHVHFYQRIDQKSPVMLFD